VCLLCAGIRSTIRATGTERSDDCRSVRNQLLRPKFQGLARRVCANTGIIVFRWSTQPTIKRRSALLMSSGNRLDQLQSSPRGIHGKSKGTGVLCVGVEGRENESGRSAQTCRCGSFSSWQVERRKVVHETEAYPVSFGSQTDQPRTESALGKGESAETQAHNISSGQKENRSRTTSEMGKGEGAAEKGWLEPAKLLLDYLDLADFFNFARCTNTHCGIGTRACPACTCPTCSFSHATSSNSAAVPGSRPADLASAAIRCDAALGLRATANGFRRVGVRPVHHLSSDSLSGYTHGHSYGDFLTGRLRQR
jgi:hypothetical protein